ncbi:hypothetical protein A3I84_01005 [Candidatus Nomurabacteria bacterium RIFCSPLOWO2_02_FULL_36_8]|nr:MAG: hypothetical protein A3I84_01005 [Candidatus Nomurabacteria bacterium RIFCSPLOWO2_02_FULL_36_8]
MNQIINDNRRRVITGQEIINFDAFSGLFLICITARVKSKKQTVAGLQNETLFIKIDDKTFPDHGIEKELINSPAGFDGDKLKDLSKTVYIITFLRGQAHTLTLNGTATLEKISIFSVDLEKTLKINSENQAEDGDRRSWITVIVDRLPLQAITTTISYARRKRDSDDVKILIDRKNQSGFTRGAKHYLWKYIGSLLPWTQSKRTETDTFILNAPTGIHIIEFWADRMPSLHDLGIDLGTVPVPFSQPTLDNPAWTGSFYDDTELMLLARAIYGEMGSEPLDAKIAVGWSVRNRVEDKRSHWGKTYYSVILQKYQYEPFTDSTKPTFKRITNPPLSNPLEKENWYDSYDSAVKVFSGTIVDPTTGANHFFSEIKDRKIPNWSKKQKVIFQIGNTKFYKFY